MSTVASLAPGGANQSNPNSIDNQIKQLEKRIGEGVKSGSITTQQGQALDKALDQVKQAVDGTGSGAAGLSATDMRQISQMLRKIGQTLSGATQNGQSASSGTDSDGDYDNSGVNTLG